MRFKAIVTGICFLGFGLALLGGGYGGYVYLTQPAYEMHFVHTNDLHAHLLPFRAEKPVCAYDEKECHGGFARLFSFIKSYREKYPDAVLLDGGDRFSGTFFYTLHKGADIIRLMNQMNYDAVTLGNHDFDDGLKEIEKMMATIKAPVVSANVIFPQTFSSKNLIKSAIVLNKNGVKIGVIGLLTPDIKTETKGGGGIELRPLMQTLQAQISALRKEGVQIIVLLSHTGDETEERLAKEVTDVDVIIGAHSHTKKFEHFVGKDGQTVLVSSAGYGGENIGAFTAVFNRLGKIVAFKNEAKIVDYTLSPDKKMQTEIDVLRTELNEITRKPVTFSETPVWAKKPQDTPRISESTNQKYEPCLEECYIGEVLSDALLRTMPSADFAFINSGAVRAGLPQGDVTVGDLIESFPFDSSIVSVQMTGTEIENYIKHGLSTFQKGRANGFIQAAGLSYTFDQDYTKSPVIHLSTGALDSLKTYTVLIPSFLAEGGDGFPVFQDPKEIAPSFRNAVIEVMRQENYKIPSFEKRIQKTKTE